MAVFYRTFDELLFLMFEEKIPEDCTAHDHQGPDGEDQFAGQGMKGFLNHHTFRTVAYYKNLFKDKAGDKIEI
jgi:hypothetical protein